eukprot:TRINITY_DN5994_c0_g1_i1.p1 TRINITY_DN5994_c0_g1~~TRINITY_DN5994_c0_g1_i1.p1  ORF type:complete len:315 (-),score=37.21 TRINITY_DN5994_c0_g1_i1:39-983(-)
MEVHKLPEATEFTSTITEIAPWRYDEVKGRWTPSFGKAENKDRQVEKLRLVTWNVWFASYQYDKRCEEISRELEKCQADVICLQEVLPEFVNKITKEDWIKSYYLSDASENGETLGRYGVLIISRIPLTNLSVHTLPSHMGRTVLRSDYTLNGDLFSVATVHLESLDSAALREHQIKVIATILRPVLHAVLMGDFNFDALTNIYNAEHKGEPLENIVLEKYVPDFVDVWSSLHPNEKGFTYDSSVNKMLQNPAHDKTRIDRVILKSNPCSSSSRRWKPTSIKLIGTSSFMFDSRKDRPVFPSDHFGLLTELIYI